MSSKKYIPTVDPLFAVVLQAYKKVKVGKDQKSLDKGLKVWFILVQLNQLKEEK
jgi:hypothetical protein